MRKQEVDYILGKMLDAHKNVSDLNVTVGRPFQVESSGELVSVLIDPPVEQLTPFQTEVFALNLLNQDRRLTEILLREGSCDLSYELAGKARFRVNVFSQRGHYSIVLRKLETRIPTFEDLNLPEAFHNMAQEKNGIIRRYRRNGKWKIHIAGGVTKRDQRNEGDPHHHLGRPRGVYPYT